MISWKKIHLLGFILTIILAVQGMAQNPVNLSAKLEPTQLKPGDKAKFVITVALDPGWHLYSIAQKPPPRSTKIALEEGGAFIQEGTLIAPKAKTAFDPNFQIDTETYEGAVNFTIPVRVKPDAAPGPQKATAKITFQVCNDTQCLPPRTRPLEVEAMIAQAALAATPSPTVSPSPSPTVSPSPSPSPSPIQSPSPNVTLTPTPIPTPTPFETLGTVSTIPPPDNTGAAAGVTAAELKSRGLFGYIWFAIISGLLALLTPCVFPMVPITVSYFTKRDQASRGQAIGHALIYALGIVFTFTGLGLLMTLIAGAAGINKLAANPWLNLFLTALFVALALNLFGLFEIRMPNALVNKLDQQSRGGGVGATLLMGLVFTLTSFTCTVAFVGQVLVFATQGEWFWSIVGMLAFSTAFAFPFFLLSVFPHWLKSLPSSGGWLNSVKVVMGFVELAAAFKFLSNVDLVWGWNTVSRNVILSGWIAIAIVTAIYLLGKIQLPFDTPMKSLGVLRMLLSVFFLGLAFYFLTGLFGANLGGFEGMLPPANLSASTKSSTQTAAAHQWIMNYDQAIAQAKATNKPVFLNFTGVTCTNCRWMESNMLTEADVKKTLENFVLAELFTDRQTPEDERHSQIQEKSFGTVALPLYVVVGPDGKELSKFPGLTRDKNEFIRFLQAGAARFNQVAQNQIQ